MLEGANGMAEDAANATGDHVRLLGPPHEGPQTGGLQRQECAVSRFWRLELRIQVSAGLGPPGSLRKGLS